MLFINKDLLGDIDDGLSNSFLFLFNDFGLSYLSCLML